jgi:hypothetical protein
MANTTGIGFFAECLEYSAKLGKHSTKALSSATLDKESSTNYISATTSLPSTFYRTLDKDFIKCHSVLDDTRQRLKQRLNLCRVSTRLSLDNETTSGALCQFFFCRVPTTKKLASAQSNITVVDQRCTVQSSGFQSGRHAPHLASAQSNPRNRGTSTAAIVVTAVATGAPDPTSCTLKLQAP